MDKLHFMVTSERGGTHAVSLSRHRLRIVLFVVSFLIIGSFFGWWLSFDNVTLRSHVTILEHDLTQTIAQKNEIETKAARQEKEQKELLDTALTELRQRSKVIESILNAVGVEIALDEGPKNAGGPFTSLPEESYEHLTVMVDHYLETIRSVPLGAPVAGKITSRFGRRVDPINKKPAFHGGIDIKNRRGTKIVAPADGVIVARGYTRGFGNFLEIDHGGQFVTRYLHMQKSVVKRGQKIQRGQVIGLVGNSGRSTGSHLHYEIKHKDKLINPLKFMQVNERLKKLRLARKNG